MKKLVIFIVVFYGNVLCSGVPTNDSRISGTEHIMKFLSKSATLWLGSYAWKNNIKTGESIDTLYAKSAGHEYWAWDAKHIKLSKNEGVRAQFKITRTHDDFVEIESTIEEHNEKKIDNDEELKKIIKIFENEIIEQKVADYCSKCRVLTQVVDFNRDTRMVEVIQTSLCNSRLVYDVFMKRINSTVD